MTSQNLRGSCQSVALTSKVLGNLLEMHIPGPYPRPVESETLRVIPTVQARANKPPVMLMC
jgi:hypothetical protein